MSIASTLDSTLGFFSPKWQLDRQLARQALASYKDLGKRRYEGASYSDKIKGWYTPKTSAITNTKMYLDPLRERSRDLVRNAPVARRIIDVYTHNIIGAGIIPQVHCENESRPKAIESELKQFIGNCDFEGRLDFYGLQALACRSTLEGGEVFVKFIRDKIGLKLQLLESEFLDPYKEGYLPDGLLCQGIELPKDQGRPRAFWLYRQHPGGFIFNGFFPESIRYDASDIVHCYYRERPGQIRGIPILSPVIMKIRDLDAFSAAQLVKAKVSACYAAFVRDVREPLDPVASKDESYLDELSPGMIEWLPHGRDVTFANPPEAPNYPEFVSSYLREIACGVGLTYEALSGDYSKVNFSSSRMAWLEFHRTIQSYQWLCFIPNLIQPIMNEFLKMVNLKGIDTSGVTISLTPPRREMIDPVAELNAMSTGIKNGIFSLSQCIRESGDEPAQRLQELANDKRLAETLGLNLECFTPEKVEEKGKDANVS